MLWSPIKEESGKMYSPDDQGENAPEVGTPSFSFQGLSDAVTALETVTEVQPPSEEFALQLEATKADCPGHQHPPTFCGMWAWYYIFSKVILH